MTVIDAKKTLQWKYKSINRKEIRIGLIGISRLKRAPGGTIGIIWFVSYSFIDTRTITQFI